VTDLTFHDYYVVAATADKVEKLQQFAGAVETVVRGQELQAQLQTLVQNLTDGQRNFADAISQGAKLCGIDDVTRNEIYSPFEFAPRIESHDDASNKRSKRLLFGGRLDANQAGIIAEFVTKLFDQSTLKESAKSLDVSTSAFIARMQIEER
jgi:hypothetical protein